MRDHTSSLLFSHEEPVFPLIDSPAFPLQKVYEHSHVQYEINPKQQEYIILSNLTH